jgi:hypothetical protein
MITNRKFTIAFAICFLLYLLPEIFASDAMLYITGGIFGGTISQILKLLSFNPESNLTFIIWGVLLLIAIYGCIKARNKAVKYLLLFIVGLLLYLIDFGLFSTVSYDTEIKNRIILNSSIKATVFMLFSVFIKSLILSWTYYKGNKS